VQLQGKWSDYQDRWHEWDDVIVGSQSDGFFVGSVGDVSFGEIGEIVNEDMEKEVSIGLPVALVVMIVVFGALVAAGLPLILGVVTIVSASSLVTILGGAIYVGDIAFSLVTMIGLAVGIDYSLVLLERYREERKRGHLKLDAIEWASASAGKAVLFSGLTTVLALFGVFFVPMAEFQGMGIAMSIAVAVAVCGALTLLPALVSLIGDWVNFPRMGMVRKLRAQDANGHGMAFNTTKLGLWGKLASAVTKRPAAFGIGVAAILLLASAPLLTMELGQPATSDLPESRVLSSYRIIAEDFSAGQETPLEIVLSDDLATEENARRVIEMLESDPLFGPASVMVSEDQSVMIVSAPFVVDSYSPDAQHKITALRDHTLVDMGLNNALVGGDPAFTYDFNHLLTGSMPMVIGFVLTLCFVVMMLAFRSLAVPVLSVVLNLLSVGAAYGAIVLVFQHGFLADALNLKQVETIVNWLPIMLFCMLFGLSMDYHVFILSRIREEWDRTGNVNAAIVNGVDHTGKIITGAAVIMVAVFGSFTMSRSVEMQQMGFGLALAIAVDVTLIRSILLPAGLKLLGTRAWWWPAWLGWVPNLHVEGNVAAESAD
jgi:RND superfamily putative drug exporter